MELRITQAEMIGLLIIAFPYLPRNVIMQRLAEQLPKYLVDLHLGNSASLPTRELIKLRAAIEWQIVCLNEDGCFNWLED